MDERNTTPNDAGWGWAPTFAPTAPEPAPTSVVIGDIDPVLRVVAPIVLLIMGVFVAVLAWQKGEADTGALRLLAAFGGIGVCISSMRSRAEVGPDQVRIVRGFQEWTVRREEIIGIRAGVAKNVPHRLLLAPGTAVATRKVLRLGNRTMTTQVDELMFQADWAYDLGEALALEVEPAPPREPRDGIFRTADGRIKATAYVYGVVFTGCLLLAIVGMAGSS